MINSIGVINLCGLSGIYHFWYPCAVAFILDVAAASGRLGDFKGKIDHNSVTVSGFSSGGYFATQFHVAYSSILRGAAIFAAGPYLCAYPGKYNIFKMGRCILFPWTFFGNAGTNVKYARLLEAQGSIDSLQNLADDRVFLYHSILDPVQGFATSKVVMDFYRNFIPSPGQLFFESGIFSGHGIPTVNYGYPCPSPFAPTFILNCGYNGAYEALNFLYDGSLNPPSASDVQQNVFGGEVVPFDQADFVPAGRTRKSISMAEKGYVYIPKKCQTADSVCKLNVFFHGCAQGSYKVGIDVVVNAGFAQVADANDIVMLFPQVIKTKKPSNPACCWDWYGYIDKKVLGDRSYATKSGPQMVAVYNMIRSLMTA